MSGPTPLEILYQDDRYTAVYKPSGLLVHRTKLDKEVTTCVLMLRNQLGKLAYPCHRLDKPTSGILLFALDSEAAAHFQECSRDGSVEKEYQAIVRGWIPSGCEINYPLKHELDDRRKSPRIQEARTRYRLVSRFEINQAVGRYPTVRYSKCLLQPFSGRMHQLRRHMSHLRHPIVGDTRHGDGTQNRFFREFFAFHRLALLASRLSFPHPDIGESLEIQTAGDKEWNTLMEVLENNYAT